jgi:MATE family multidrug resistance protein
MTMSWPIILGSVSYTVMEFFDKWMVAKLGTEPLAAVGSSGLWSFTLSTLFLGIVGCVSVFAAQSLGRDRKEDCARYAWQGIYLSIAAGLLTLLLWPLSGPLFRSMHHGEVVQGLELSYFRIRLLGYIPMAWTTALAAFFQAVNRPRVPMWTAVVANINNLVFNYLLIFGKFGFPALGISGAAISTVMSQTLQLVLLQAVFTGPSFHREFRTRSAWRFDPALLRQLIRIGLPSGTSMFLDIFNWGIFTSYVVGRFGDVSLAAHNVAITFMQVCFMPAVAVNQGIAAIVGQWVGRGDIPRAKARTYTAIRLAMTYMTCMGLIFALFGGRLIESMFSHDPGVIQLGHRLLILAAIFQAFDAVNIICMGALRGAGDTRWIMWLMFIGAYLFFLPLALVLAFPMQGGAFGAWIGATIYIILLSGVLFARFHGAKWRHIDIFRDGGGAGDLPAPAPAADARAD